jgi:hypothetical protein
MPRWIPAFAGMTMCVENAMNFWSGHESPPPSVAKNSSKAGSFANPFLLLIYGFVANAHSVDAR